MSDSNLNSPAAAKNESDGHGARRGGPPPPGQLICSVGQVSFKIKVLACAAAVAFPDSGRAPGPTCRGYCLSVRRQGPSLGVPTRRGRAAAVTVGPQVQVCAALAASSGLRGPGPGPAGSDSLLHTLAACHLRQLDVNAANWTWSYRANDLDRDLAVTQARSPVPHGIFLPVLGRRAGGFALSLAAAYIPECSPSLAHAQTGRHARMHAHAHVHAQSPASPALGCSDEACTRALFRQPCQQAHHVISVSPTDDRRDSALFRQPIRLITHSRLTRSRGGLCAIPPAG